jgi:hypothetical protein
MNEAGKVLFANSANNATASAWQSGLVYCIGRLACQAPVPGAGRRTSTMISCLVQPGCCNRNQKRAPGKAGVKAFRW